MYDFSKITEVSISNGAHDSPEQGMCAMEMVAWFNGEEHSDSPECTSPVLATFVRIVNDSMSDEIRNKLLKPILPKLVGTVSPEHETARAEILTWFAVNEAAPMALRSVGLDDHADTLEKCSTLTEASHAAHAASSAADVAASPLARAAAQVIHETALAALASNAALNVSNAASNAACAASHVAEWSSHESFYEPVCAALVRAIEAGPQGEFKADPAERHQALRELITA